MIFLFLFLLFAGVPAVQAQDYVLAPSLSEVTFDADSTLHAFHGKAPSLQAGTVSFDSSTGNFVPPAEVVISVTGLDTSNQRRDKNMKKMFEAAKFPRILWHVISMECQPAKVPGKWVCQQKGNLTIHGITHEYILPLLVSHEGEEDLETEGVLEIKLHDFNLEPASVMRIIKVQDLVRIHLKARWKPK